MLPFHRFYKKTQVLLWVVAVVCPLAESLGQMVMAVYGKLYSFIKMVTVVAVFLSFSKIAVSSVCAAELSLDTQPSDTQIIETQSRSDLDFFGAEDTEFNDWLKDQNLRYSTSADKRLKKLTEVTLECNQNSFDIKIFVQSLLSEVAVPACTGTVAGYATYLLGKKAMRQSYPLDAQNPGAAAHASSAGQVGLVTSAMTMAGQIISGLINSIGRVATGGNVNEYFRYRRIADALDLYYRDYILTLPKDFQNAYQKRLNQLHAYGSDSDRTTIELMQVFFLSFPQKPLNVAQFEEGGNARIGEIIEHRVEKLVDSYPESMRANLYAVIRDIRGNSIYPEPAPVYAYLSGPPGTGKTRFVLLLGKALGLNVCHIKLSEKDLSKIFGPAYSLQGDKTIEEAMGQIALCFSQFGFTNPLLFIDEVEDVLNEEPEPSSVSGSASGSGLSSWRLDSDSREVQSTFKKMMDPETPEFLHRSTGVVLKMDRVTVVFASNRRFRNKALQSRMNHFEFTRLTEVEKTMCGEKALRKALNNQAKVLNTAELFQLEKWVSHFIPYILEQDVLHNDGGRIVQSVIRTFVNRVTRDLLDQKRMALLLDLKRRDSVLDQELIQIEEAYHQFIYNTFKNLGDYQNQQSTPTESPELAPQQESAERPQDEAAKNQETREYGLQELESWTEKFLRTLATKDEPAR